MRKPCKHCPFRNDIKPFLHPARAQEIATAISDLQQSFTCHKTTVEVEDDDECEGGSRREDGPNAQHCAGAMIILEKMERPNQMMRIAERLGMYDHTKLDMESAVYDSLDEWVEAHYEHEVEERVRRRCSQKKRSKSTDSRREK